LLFRLLTEQLKHFGAPRETRTRQAAARLATLEHSARATLPGVRLVSRRLLLSTLLLADQAVLGPIRVTAPPIAGPATSIVMRRLSCSSAATACSMPRAASAAAITAQVASANASVAIAWRTVRWRTWENCLMWCWVGS